MAEKVYWLTDEGAHNLAAAVRDFFDRPENQERRRQLDEESESEAEEDD